VEPPVAVQQLLLLLLPVHPSAMGRPRGQTACWCWLAQLLSLRVVPLLLLLKMPLLWDKQQPWCWTAADVAASLSALLVFHQPHHFVLLDQLLLLLLQALQLTLFLQRAWALLLIRLLIVVRVCSLEQVDLQQGHHSQQHG
jgi:hypothetical protein